MSEQVFGIAFASFMVLVVVGCVYTTWRDKNREQNVIKEAHQKLCGKKFVVAIRTKDGKRHYWETLFIKQLMDLGATVLDFSPEVANHLWTGDRSQIPDGAFAFVGTTWESGGVWYIDGKFIPEKEKVVAENEPVLAPFFSVHGDVAKLHTNLAECVRHYL